MKLVMFVLCSAVGALVGYAVPVGPWTPYLPLMVGYHLFLIYLLVSTALGGDQKVGFSLSIAMTVITHAAFLAALVGLVMGRHYVPWFGIVRYFVPGLAPFEANWLFQGATKRRPSEDERPRMPEATMDEYNEFLEYLRQPVRKFMQSDRDIHKEFASWLAARKKHVADTTDHLTPEN